MQCWGGGEEGHLSLAEKSVEGVSRTPGLKTDPRIDADGVEQFITISGGETHRLVDNVNITAIGRLTTLNESLGEIGILGLILQIEIQNAIPEFIGGVNRRTEINLRAQSIVSAYVHREVTEKANIG